MTIDFEFGFVIATLYTADCPIPTSPKSTVPGVTWIMPCKIGRATSVPHPEIVTVTQQMAAKTSAVHRP